MRRQDRSPEGVNALALSVDHAGHHTRAVDPLARLPRTLTGLTILPAARRESGAELPHQLRLCPKSVEAER